MEFLCRTCFKFNITRCNIFESLKNGELISELLMELASIQKDDGYPDNICESCLQKLLLVHDFKLMIIESDKKLLREIQNSINKVEKSLQPDISQKIFVEEEIEDIDSEQVEFSPCASNVQNSADDTPYIDCQSIGIIDENIIEEETCDSQVNDLAEIIDLESPNSSRDSFEANLKNGICTTNNLMETETSTTNNQLDHDTVPHQKDLNATSLDNPKYKPNVKFQLISANTSTEKETYKCDFCKKSFENKKKLKRHWLVHRKNKELVCDICGEDCTSLQNWKRHTSLHMCLRPYSCLVCGKKFRCKRYLKDHLLVHSEEKKYGCKICSSKHRYRSDLHYHMKKHKKSRRMEI